MSVEAFDVRVERALVVVVEVEQRDRATRCQEVVQWPHDGADVTHVMQCEEA